MGSQPLIFDTLACSLFPQIKNKMFLIFNVYQNCLFPLLPNFGLCKGTCNRYFFYENVVVVVVVVAVVVVCLLWHYSAAY